MIPPSSTTEVSVDGVEKENEVEQPPSPASTTSQESKVGTQRLRSFFFFFLLFLCFEKRCVALIFIWSPVPGSVVECYELPLDCGACSDTPTPEFSLSPGQLRSLNWGNTCLLRCLVWGIFARVFFSLLK